MIPPRRATATMTSGTRDPSPRGRAVNQGADQEAANGRYEDQDGPGDGSDNIQVEGPGAVCNPLDQSDEMPKRDRHEASAEPDQGPDEDHEDWSRWSSETLQRHKAKSRNDVPYSYNPAGSRSSARSWGDTFLNVSENGFRGQHERIRTVTHNAPESKRGPSYLSGLSSSMPGTTASSPNCRRGVECIVELRLRSRPLSSSRSRHLPGREARR